MSAPERDDRRKEPGRPARSGGAEEQEEAAGEVQQKDAGQKRQAGETVEDVRERIRDTQPRQRE